MSVIIGLDVGGSTTKIIGSVVGQNSKISFMRPLQVKANDPKTSVYGAFGRYISENGLQISDISKIRITGVGASLTS